jgi:hypothetical protein
VIFSNVHVPDVTPLEPRFVRNGPDNVARLHAVHMAYFNSESLVRDIVLTTPLPRRRLAPLVVAGLLALCSRNGFDLLAFSTSHGFDLLAFCLRPTLRELRMVARQLRLRLLRRLRRLLPSLLEPIMCPLAALSARRTRLRPLVPALAIRSRRRLLAAALVTRRFPPRSLVPALATSLRRRRSAPAFTARARLKLPRPPLPS